jgi:HEAT repeat protein
LGKAEPAVLEGLVSLLGDEDESVRWRAADALGELGKAEPRVLEGLVGLLGDRDIGAISAFRKLRDEPTVVSVLLTATVDEDEAVRSGAAIALDMGHGLYFNREKPPAIALQHLSPLKQLLDNEMEVNYSAFPGFPERHLKVKDLAWILLQHYSDETGERIYCDDWGD